MRRLDTGAQPGGSQLELSGASLRSQRPLHASGARTGASAQALLRAPPLNPFRNIRLRSQDFRPSIPPPAPSPPAGMTADQANLPMRDPPTVLRLLALVSAGSLTLIKATTGAGKTIQTILLLLEEGEAAGKPLCMLVLQPRRLAAEGVAARLAMERGEEVGETVGLVLRGVRITSPATVVYVMTYGVLQAMLQTPGCLRQVQVVILDEAHERSLQQDLILAYLRCFSAELKPSLALIILSATFPDAQRDKIRRCLKDWRWAEMDVVGRTFPLQINYEAESKRVAGGWTEGSGLSLTAALLRALAHVHKSFLVFEPALGKLEPLRKEVEDLFDRDPRLPRYVSFTLHKRRADPEKRPGGAVHRPPPDSSIKLIFASVLAQSSITIADIDVVVDLGTAKQSLYSQSGEAERLVECRCSQSAADQRAGRAGRTKPGFVFRLYPRNLHLGDDKPEILSSDLRPVLLWAALASPPSQSPSVFVDCNVPEQPPPHTLAWAVRELQQMGLMGPKQRLTETGYFAAVSGLGPSDALSVLHALTLACLRPILWVVAVREQEALAPCCGRPRDPHDPLRRARLATASASLSETMIHFAAVRDFRAARLSDSAQSDVAEELGLDKGAMRLVRGRVSQLEKKLQKLGFLAKPGSTADVPSLVTANENSECLVAVKACLAAGAFPRCVLVRSDGELASRVLKMGQVKVGGARGYVQLKDIPRAQGPVLLAHHTTVLPPKGTKGQLADVNAVPALGLCLMGGPSRVELDERREERPGWQRKLPPNYSTIPIGPVSFEARTNEEALFIRKLARSYRDIVAMKIVRAGSGGETVPSQQDRSTIDTVLELLRVESERLGLPVDADLSIVA